MSHNHKHDHCFHIIKHCALCDTAYCTKCSKEWGVNSTFTPYTPPFTTTTNAPDLNTWSVLDAHTHSY